MELAPDQGLQPADQPTDLRRRCEEEAQEIVRQANSSTTGQLCVESEKLTDLISRLTAILLQIKVKRLQKIVSPIKYVVLKLCQFLCAELKNTFCFLLLQCLAEGGDLNSFEFKSLTDSLNDIKNSIDSSNIRYYFLNI